ncbi:MAG TPA: GNAT family N-acetyltransferase [Candidatus Eisenbergiella merdipullorum]|uniref:GNAT family N-acetyltransferase n=1 Tax=Candidatus Eisenbergiella merdipullorum TaxID=2838553 RepID=A0A9D2I3B5_9FIRM|nr:GNAT family N-acetyltransferase [Candidatus Eisenbergiella merdipullorum]
MFGNWKIRRKNLSAPEAFWNHYHTGDLFVCGVLPEYHRKGIGETLYTAVETYFIQNGCDFVIVKTLSDIIHYGPYAQTRKFYEKIGFSPLITLTEMWDENNPCLIMIKPLHEFH